ncbi:MAG TPA: amidohydrolase family protein [Candidatus Margulisiibacteriota bacterium]|nr:amidohydrolase family protein [Candidatus Margulisiibacteriota bacterium]
MRAVGGDGRQAAPPGGRQAQPRRRQYGADRVIYGSDWPHMEGLEHPRDIIEELDGIAAADLEKILYRNTAGLNERRPF